MCKWFCWCSREPNGCPGSYKGHVKPEGQAMYCAGLNDVKLDRDFNPMKVSFLCFGKIDHMALTFCKANTNVKRVHLRTGQKSQCLHVGSEATVLNKAGIDSYKQ